MAKYIVLLFALLQISFAKAQRTQGLTHKPDTSFTNYSAYLSAKKKYPNIVLAKDSLPPSVKVEKNITYLTVDLKALQMDVFSPKSLKSKKAIAVIIIHGGGWRSGNRTQHYPLAQKLAEQGYVCFTPAYRLSTEALYPAGVHDLKAAVRWVKANANKFKLDTSKVVALGFSAGGQLATLLGASKGVTALEGNSGNVKQSSSVSAVIDIDGTLAFIHPESGEGDDSRSISAATNWFGYGKTEKPELWKQAAALTYAGPKTPPTLFINSALDRMHAGRADYIDILNKYNIYTEVHAFPNSPHTYCLFEP